MSSTKVDTQGEAIGSSFNKPSTSRNETAEDREDFQVLMDDVGDAVVDYCRRRPGVAGGVLFALGFFVGWRLKPW